MTATTPTALRGPDLDELTARVRGPVLTPGSPGYEAECATFNRAVTHRPAVVVGVTGPADVAAAVRFAARRALPTGVQATGHGASVPSDGGVLISTRRMTALHVDPHARTARVGAGVRWEQVVRAGAAFGLAPLNGSSPLVGVVGYTLGGGMGPLGRKFGYAADHVRNLEMVTADGRTRTVSSLTHPDLFWGVRGGKGNVGVVTALEFDLAPVSRLYGGGLWFPGEQAAGVLRRWSAWTRGVTEETTSSVALLRLPDLPGVPEPLRARLTVHVRIAFLGSRGDGEDLVRPLRAAGTALIDTLGEMSYRDVARIHEDTTEPVAYRERNVMLRALDDDVVDTLLRHTGAGTACRAPMIELRHLGGALGRQPDQPNAVDNRDAAHCLTTVSPPGDDGMASALFADLAPWGTGRCYVNFLSGSADEDISGAYDPETLRRLRTLKDAYDPQNLFRTNQNIRPTNRES